MNISKDSWHYKLIDTFGPRTRVPSNLCPYVRRLLLSLASLVGVSVFVLGTAAFILVLTGLGIGSIAGFIVTGVLHGDAVISLFFLMLGLITTHFIFMDVDGEYRRVTTAPHRAVITGILGTEAQRNAKRAEEPGIIRAYLKAKHDKICPSLDFSGESNGN